MTPEPSSVLGAVLVILALLAVWWFEPESL